MTKATLRKLYKEKRKAITDTEKLRCDDLILINFQQLDLPFISCVHTYIAIEEQNEIETDNITGYLKFINPGIKIVVPKINLDKGEMQHYIYDEEMQVKKNSFGIIEPLKGEKVNAQEVDLVITPLLAFDKKGYRVGYGKGFYDKFFQQCRNDVIKVGLSYFEPEEIIDNISGHDIPLDFCITPANIYSF